MDVESARNYGVTKLVESLFPSYCSIFLSLCLGASLTSALAQALDLGSPDRTELPERPVNFSLKDGLPVMIGNQGPFFRGFDTGQSIPCLLSPSFAERLGLKVVGNLQPGDNTGRKTPTAQLVEIPFLSLGGARLHNLRGLVVSSIRRGGALGFGLFQEGLLTLDLLTGSFDLRRGELDAGEPDVLSYNATHGIPVIQIALAGHPITAMLDTGSGRYLTLPKSLAEELPLRGELEFFGEGSTLFNQGKIWLGTLSGALAIGHLKIQDPVLDFSDLFEEALLGRPFLEQYVVTFDLRNRRLRLRPSDARTTLPER